MAKYQQQTILNGLSYGNTNLHTSQTGKVRLYGGDLYVHGGDDDADYTRLHTVGGNSYMDYSGSNLYIRKHNSVAISLDSDKDARFYGNVSIGVAGNQQFESETNGADYGYNGIFNNQNSSANIHKTLVVQKTGSDSCVIYSNGNIQNRNGSYGSISDIRLKENIQDAPSQWDDIKNVRFRKFNLINDSVTQLGVIAQELSSSGMAGLVYEVQPTKFEIAISSSFGTLYQDGDVLPDGVSVGDVKTYGDMVLGVKSSILTQKALVALQEAMERIETLEAKVAALENQ